MCSSVALSTFIVLYNHHLSLVPKCFISPKETPYSLAVIPYSPLLPTSTNMSLIVGNRIGFNGVCLLPHMSYL